MASTADTDASYPTVEPVKSINGKGKGKGKGGPPPPKAQSADERDAARLEAAKKKEQEKREREEQQARQRLDNDAREALKARLPNMIGLDVFSGVPWSSAIMTVKLAGDRENSGALDPLGGPRKQAGVTAVELEDNHAVCLRCVAEIIDEFFAESMAVCLDVPVARSRLVRPDEDEYQAVKSMLKRLAPNMGWADVEQFGNPDSPFMLKMRETNPEGWESITKQLGHCPPFAVLEFVTGYRLDDCESVVFSSLPDFAWTSLGKLCALDVLLNNMDRLPLPVFDNRDGNIGNVMVMPEGPAFIGIDQQVNVILDEAGCEAYLEKVQSLVQRLTQAGPAVAPGADDHAFGPDAVITHIRGALQKCGKEFADASAACLLQGMRATFLQVAKEWSSGQLAQSVCAAEASASERIVEGQMRWQDGHWSAPVIDSTSNSAAIAACAEFLRKVATAISDASSRSGLAA